jgi:anaphase-promoting complex subunit 10
MMEIEDVEADAFNDVKRYQRSEEAPRETSKIKEIGDEAIWTLSTAKTGNGVQQIRDDCIETFWQ